MSNAGPAVQRRPCGHKAHISLHEQPCAICKEPSVPVVEVPLDLLEGIARRLYAAGDDFYREQIEPLIDAVRAAPSTGSEE